MYLKFRKLRMFDRKRHVVILLHLHFQLLQKNNIYEKAH